MEKLQHPAETLVVTLLYREVEFELVQRPDVLWVGCVDYAEGNQGESNVGATLQRFQELVGKEPIREKMNPAWSAALSLNYTRDDKPCGLMFANESHSDKQDERYDMLVQPGGLWLRVPGGETASKALLGKDNAEPWEYFAGGDAPLQSAAKAHGYRQNPEIPIQIEYHCHEEYGKEHHRSYAYIPVCP